MATVAELRAQLNLFYQQFDKALKHVDSTSRKTGKAIERNLSSKAPAKAFKKTTEAVAQTAKAVKKTTQATSNWVWTATSGIKAVSRVVYGILIAQTFYRLINAVQEAARSMWQFQVSMEQAYLALELLLDSARGAELMLRRLETFAALTPFQMGDVITGTRRLMGFGFTAQEVLPILEALADATAIIGVSPQQLDDLTRALGKIRATGRMTAREIRSFGAAGIPIFQILQDELGLTREQIRNIGREAAGQANIVIPAILRGLESRFGGAAERLARTVGGLLSTIQDDLLLITKDIFGGLYEAYRGLLGGLVDRLEELRDILIKTGVGGFFEALIPPEYHQIIRTMIAGLQSIGKALLEMHNALKPVRDAFIDFFIHTLAIIIPILSVVITSIARFFTWALQGETIIKRLTIAVFGAAAAFQAMLIVIVVANALKKLMVFLGAAAALTHKWLLIIAIIIGALAYWALSIKKVRDWLERAFNSLAKFLGLDTTSILQPLAALDEALPDETDWHQIQEGALEAAEGIEDIGDEAADTKKKLDKFLLAFDEVYAIPEKAEKLELPDLADIKMPDLEEFDPEQWWGDFSDEVEETIEDIEEEFDSFGSNIWEWLKNFFKSWWNMLKETFLAYVQLFKDLAIATWNFIRESWRAFLQLFKDLWNAVKQFAKDILGALIQLTKDLWNAITTFAKGIWGAFSQVFKDLWNAIKEFTKGIWDAITQLVKDLWNALVTFVKGFWEAIKQLVKDIFSARTLEDVITAFKTFFGTVGELFLQWFSSTKEAFSNFFTSIYDATVRFGERIWTAFSNFFTRIYDATAQFGQNILTAFSNFFTRIYNATIQFGESIWTAFSNFFTRIGEAITTFAERIGEAFKTFFTRVLNAVETYVSALLGGLWDKIMRGIRIEEFFNMLYNKMKSGIDALVNLISSSVTKAVSLITERIPAMLTSALARIKQFLINLGNVVLAKFNSILSSIGNTITRVVNAVTRAINAIIRLINKIPFVNIPTIPTKTTTSVKTTGVTGMAKGGILNKEQFVKAAEGGRPEAYTPLTAVALKPWAEAIASALGGAGRGTPTADTGYVAIPIDQKGKVDLERQLFVIRKREVARGNA